MYQLDERISFPVPLSSSAHELADRLRQSNPAKAQQIYLNTLAVYAVDFYLRFLGIETELEKSDSQDPVHLNFLDVADLQVKSIGRLECRPVLPGATELEIPVEVREDRVGYMAVQFDRSLREAKIIGFATTAAASIPLDRLYSIDAFPEYLEHLQSPVQVETNLRQWVASCFEEGWQELNSILNPAQLAYRSSPTANAAMLVGREKIIQLVTTAETVNLILVAKVESYSEDAIKAWVSILPGSDRGYLPAALQVRILDEQRIVVVNRTAGEDNPKIELPFIAESGEHFTVQISLGETSVNENFVA